MTTVTPQQAEKIKAAFHKRFGRFANFESSDGSWFIEGFLAALEPAQHIPTAQDGWKPVADYEAVIRSYVEDYEMIGETADGRDACHIPTESEKALIFDAFMGFDHKSVFSHCSAPQVPMAEAETDLLWDSFNDAPTMSYRYLVTKAVEAHHKIGVKL